MWSSRYPTSSGRRLANPSVVYGLLFAAAAETLSEVAADPKHLRARIGFLAVLHTWGQALQHHPHVHCVVPGGGLALDESRWIAARATFFLPVRVLSRVFRGKFLAQLKAAHERGQLVFGPRVADLAERAKVLLHRASRRCMVASARRDRAAYNWARN